MRPEMFKASEWYALCYVDRDVNAFTFGGNTNRLLPMEGQQKPEVEVRHGIQQLKGALRFEGWCDIPIAQGLCRVTQ